MFEKRGSLSSACCYDVEKDNLAFFKVDEFLPNKIYYHGCLKIFLQITKWNGPELVGRTATIVHELEWVCSGCAKVLRFQTNRCPICRQLVGRLLEIKVNNGAED
ncbi:hypothetical protein L6452_20383 [Arctium lappa]|uniref:Uncharacterized protein n=1 Tax=Arctium lappa TaxID=4217 RepID=A0ACB9BC23_ARCLA|nr:hypothetical protein L6452_20383 [Arctium lappa]